MLYGCTLLQSTFYLPAITAVLLGMKYLSDWSWQDTLCSQLEDEFKREDPRVLAALEMILPDNAAEAASRLDAIKGLRSLKFQQALDTAAMNKQFSEAQAGLSSCQGLEMKDRETFLAKPELIRTAADILIDQGLSAIKARRLAREQSAERSLLHSNEYPNRQTRGLSDGQVLLDLHHILSLSNNKGKLASRPCCTYELLVDPYLWRTHVMACLCVGIL